MAQNDDNSWGYGIRFDDLVEGWDIEECYLISCNKFRKKNDIYGENPTMIAVSVDPETGEGKVICHNEEDNSL